MKLIGRQIVVELPETRSEGYDYGEYKSGADWNAAIDEIARMNPAWEVDITGIKNVIESWLSCGESRLTPDDVKDIAQALAADPSAWLKRKDANDKEKS